MLCVSKRDSPTVRSVIARSAPTKQSRATGSNPDCFALVAMTAPIGLGHGPLVTNHANTASINGPGQCLPPLSIGPAWLPHCAKSKHHDPLLVFCLCSNS